MAELQLQTRDAADYLGISERHLYNIRKSARLSFKRKGTSTFYKKSSLEKFIKSRAKAR